MDLFGLRTGDIEAWTYLLRQAPDLIEVVIADVQVASESDRVTRYELTLEGQTEIVQFWLLQTNSAEVSFFNTFRKELSQFLPTCWFAEVDQDQVGWIVLNQVDLLAHKRPSRWRLSHAIEAIELMAKIHARYWDIPAESAEWLKPFLSIKAPAATSLSSTSGLMRPTSQPKPTARPFTSPYEAGDPVLAPFFQPTRRHLKAVHSKYGHIVNGKVVELAETLIRQPHLVLHPIFSLPQTLLHGRPTLDQWRFDVLGDRYLIHWREVSYGPAVCDLVQFIRAVDRGLSDTAQGEPIDSTGRQEALLDSYFLTLFNALVDHHGYDVRYSSKYFRRFSLPAAECWYFLDRVLPTTAYADPVDIADLEKETAQFIQAVRLLTTGLPPE